MKKLLLIGTVLAGGLAASQAGVNFHVSFGLPGLQLPGVPRMVARASAPVVCAPAPVVAQSCAPEIVVETTPVCEPAPVVTVAPCEPIIVEHRPVVIRERDYGRDRHYAFRQDRWNHGRDGHRR